jgi:serine/threonine-protein kinase
MLSRVPEASTPGQAIPPTVTLSRAGSGAALMPVREPDSPPSAPIQAQPKPAADGGIAYDATDLAMVDSIGHRAVCERCWSVMPASASRCSDAACNAPRPDGGWPTLPYRFRDRYVFTSQLGRGSMGAVFIARDDKQSGAARAIKVMREGSPAEASRLRALFEQEIRAAGLLGQQEGFVRVSAFDINGAQPFLEMELVEWPTLRAWFKQGGHDAHKVVQMAMSVLEGMMVMHEHNMIHRDLKPENIFVHAQQSGFRTKIADLGGWTYDCRARTKGIGIQEIVGTVPYLSPEQTRVGELTTATDVFSIACITWEALTGSLPFPVSGMSVGQRLHHRQEVTKKLPPRPEAMPKALYRLLTKAMAYEPERRATAHDMHTALASFLQGDKRARSTGNIASQAALSSIAFRPPPIAEPAPRNRGRRALAWLGALVVVGAIAAAVFLFVVQPRLASVESPAAQDTAPAAPAAAQDTAPAAPQPDAPDVAKR